MRSSFPDAVRSMVSRTPVPVRVLIAVTVALLVVGGSAAMRGDAAHQAVAAAGSPTTTERHPAATATTATTLPLAPEGVPRAGTGLDEPNGTNPDANTVDRSLATDTLLTTLASMAVRREEPRTGYSRDLFHHWDDDDHDGCDTRCEVLAAQRRPDGTWLSEWDGYSTTQTIELQVDHVVSLAEAWDSGANTWSAAQRDEFADYLPNLLAVTAAENLRKGDKDAAEWFPARADANCLWASTVVRVKSHWSLSVDQAEQDALGHLLRTCSDFVPPTTTTIATTTTATPHPPPTPPTTPTTVAPPAANDCTPGYDPCIPPGPDVDCAGGSGDGPRYVKGPVSVTGSDPYRLDSDHDGVGCE